jgi:hypothetical protein
MPLFRKKPVVIEAITFDELINHGKSEYVKANRTMPYDMPWSFAYKGHEISHESDSCYIIPTLEGPHFFTPLDMLITGVHGEIYPCKIDIFNKTYEPVLESNAKDNREPQK